MGWVKSEREREMGCEIVNVIIRRKKKQVVVVQALIEPNKEKIGYIYMGFKKDQKTE